MMRSSALAPCPCIPVFGMCYGTCPKDHFHADRDQQSAGLTFHLLDWTYLMLLLCGFVVKQACFPIV